MSKFVSDWWTRWPKLFEREIAAFRRFSVDPQVVYQAAGLLVLEVQWPIEGKDDGYRLRIGFSPMHPFFPPEVSTDVGAFSRHQNPFSGALCLLTQETGQWQSEQLVADFISERLYQLIEVSEARDQANWHLAGLLEENAPDPKVPYFNDQSEDGSVILFDGATELPKSDYGYLNLRVAKRSDGVAGAPPVEIVVESIVGENGHPVLSSLRMPRAQQSRGMVGRWVKVQMDGVANADELLKLAEDQFSQLEVMRSKPVNRLKQKVNKDFLVTGLVFQDEIAYGDKSIGAGWLFVLQRADSTGRLGKPILIMPQRAGEGDIFARLPVASALRSRKVALIGCGAVGSFVASELARAGVKEITLVDCDTVETGNSLRWVLGRKAWGRKKVAALGEFLQEQYPATRIKMIYGKFGATTSNFEKHRPGAGGMLQQFLELFSSSDLVVDASASVEVQQAAAYYCAEVDVPYLMGYATLGVCGGVVARFTCDLPCLKCLYDAWNAEAVPLPQVDEAETILPVGCNAPVFTGSSFDLQEISMEMSRTAVGMLSGGAYDPGAWQLAILSMKGNNGGRIAPVWSVHSVAKQAECDCCNLK